MDTPYARASSGENARAEMIRMLRRFGCASIGFLDDYEKGELILQFSHRKRQLQLKASASGWAALYMKDHPYNYRLKITEAEYKRRCLNQGLVAINSILRDWVKGQIMAIETGIMTFEAAFLPLMLTNDGRTVAERADQLGLLEAR
jgi:hypothetical protein